MDFPIPSEYQFPILIGIILGCIILFLVYEFRLKETAQFPLANEEDLGIGRISLNKLGIYLEGRMTTAANLFARNFGKIIAGTSTTEERASILAFRDKFMKHYSLAIRDGRKKSIILFDDNPLDRKYCARQDKGADVPIRSIGPIQDCGVEDEFDGFLWYWAKLDKNVVPATAGESKENQSILAGIKYTRLAAVNSDENRILKEDNKNVRELLDQERKSGAEIAARLDRALGALKQHSLSEPESNKMPSAWGPKVKEWFASPWQIAVAIGAYLVSPLILNFFAGSIPPTSTAYVTLAITVAGFFTIPFFKKVFGRWL